jgi:hypothetical protein
MINTSVQHHLRADAQRPEGIAVGCRAQVHFFRFFDARFNPLGN